MIWDGSLGQQYGLEEILMIDKNNLCSDAELKSNILQFDPSGNQCMI